MMSVKDKQTLYRQVLGNEGGRQLLTDLNAFCNGTQSHKTNDPMELMRLEGRREVFLQIMNMLKVNYEEYYDEYVEDDF